MDLESNCPFLARNVSRLCRKSSKGLPHEFERLRCFGSKVRGHFVLWFGPGGCFLARRLSCRKLSSTRLRVASSCAIHLQRVLCRSASVRWDCC